MSFEQSLRNAEQKIAHNKSLLFDKISQLEIALREPLQDDWDDALDVASVYINEARANLHQAVRALKGS